MKFSHAGYWFKFYTLQFYLTGPKEEQRERDKPSVWQLRHSNERAAQKSPCPGRRGCSGTVYVLVLLESKNIPQVTDCYNLLLNVKLCSFIQLMCARVCVCVVLFNANVTEKAMVVEDLQLMSAWAPACRRAASVPSGCRSHTAS